MRLPYTDRIQIDEPEPSLAPIDILELWMERLQLHYGENETVQGSDVSEQMGRCIEALHTIKENM